MEIFLKNHTLKIDGNPMIAWYFQNTELKTDIYGNVKPMKANGVLAKKIDGVIAAIEALSAPLYEQIFTGEVISLDL
jgi:phage terminase large subunit-like protein